MCIQEQGRATAARPDTLLLRGGEVGGGVILQGPPRQHDCTPVGVVDLELHQVRDQRRTLVRRQLVNVGAAQTATRVSGACAERGLSGACAVGGVDGRLI